MLGFVALSYHPMELVRGLAAVWWSVTAGLVSGIWGHQMRAFYDAQLDQIHAARVAWRNALQ